MSNWARIDVEFRSAKRLDDSDRETIQRQMPTGSEDGPSVSLSEQGTAVWIQGPMRDFDDEDAPAALGWFLNTAKLPWLDIQTAEMTLTIDNGPRYRWTWTPDGLQRLRGILDL